MATGWHSRAFRYHCHREGRIVFSPRIPQKTLSNISRSLSTMLRSGVDLIRAVDIVAKKSGNAACRRRLGEVADDLRSGDDLTGALKQQDGYFPVLFVDMIHVAESTGNMPEVLKELADHYEKNLRLRREFMGWVAWPLFQLFAAIFVVALMILVLGMLGTPDPVTGKALDPLGFGLSGASGALTWLGYAFGSMFALVFLYQLLTRGLGQQRGLHRLFLRIPVLGKCLQSFATARFSWGFFLTQDAGMPIGPSLDASFKATGNQAFASAAPAVISDVMAGDDLGRALENTELFTDEYIHIVQVAEASGTVPEELHRLSPELEDQARRAMKKMAATAGIAVWMSVAALIIFLILRIVLWYTGMLNDLAKGI
ncbi:type II secretion system F family protein [Symmachiella dynata]|uniref:type II secretion system F family protein n=1 Tax=Symmachiella dynata TaxID=2527995 RepID=UPI0030EDE558